MATEEARSTEDNWKNRRPYVRAVSAGCGAVVFTAASWAAWHGNAELLGRLADSALLLLGSVAGAYVGAASFEYVADGKKSGPK